MAGATGHTTRFCLCYPHCNPPGPSAVA